MTTVSSSLRARACPTFELVTEPELGDELAIALDVRPLHVVEQPAAPTDHLEQATTRVVVLAMGLEVVVEVVDAVRQHRHLHARRAGVGFGGAVLLDRRGLVESHVTGCSCRAI